MSICSEYTALYSLWEKALFGSYLIVPLKYSETPNHGYIDCISESITLTTMDIGENIKDLINCQDAGNIGRVYRISAEKLEKELLGNLYTQRNVQSDGYTGTFSFFESYLFVFHTKVAFLCVGFRFDKLQTFYNICNPGFASLSSSYTGKRQDGETERFSLDQALCAFAEKCGMMKFFDGNAPAIIESYAYTLALLPERFPSIEVMRQATFNLHMMTDLNNPLEDESENDLRYVYAVKTPALGTYRWGCCVSSQTISYVVADPAMNIAQEMRTQAEDGLPVVLIALYEKYTCLRFTELLSRSDNRDKKKLDLLKKMMLRFQAYGTVTPSNLSRWHNVKQIYAALLAVNDTAGAVNDIDSKLKILAERQKDMEQQRNDTISGIITVFGVVSIADSMLSIVQSLSGGQSVDWITVYGTVAALIVVIAIMLRKLRGK